MSKQYQVIHKKSNVLTNGQPKLPSASTIEYGEIAINYAKGGETMSIKNANNEIVTFSSDAKILGQMPAVADYFDGAEYDSNSKRINFKHGNTVKAYIDATDFIKDGMVDDVAVTTPTSGDNSGVTCLVVTFNTESGKEDIEIPLSLIFDPSDYYNKDDADEKFLTISAYTEDEEVVAAALNDLNDRIEQIYVPHNVSDLYNDLGFVDSSHTHSQYATTAHTHTASEVGAMETSERSNYSTTGHTHSEYATTAHTHTAAEVGAMATSERSNYLPTGTTLDNVADGSTRKLSNYSLTSHTHSEYATTSDTANFITSADTEIVEIRLPSSYHAACNNSSGAALPSGTYNSIANILANGQTPIIVFEDQSLGASTPFYCGVDMRYEGEVDFFAIPNDTDNVYYDRLTVLSNDNGTIKTYYLAKFSQLPTESTIASSGFTKNGLTSADTVNFITSADTGIKVYEISVSGELNAINITNALPQNFYSLAMADLGNGILPVIKITMSDGSVIPLWFEFHADGQENLVFSYSYYNQIYTYVCDSENIDIQYTRYDLLNEGLLRMKLTQSGYTQSGITGINVNGSATTVTGGVADITIPSGLPAVTAADNGKVAMVVNGQWTASMPTIIYTGTNSPDNTLGNDGDIYLQTS